jgi:hypothetical protein
LIDLQREAGDVGAFEAGRLGGDAVFPGGEERRLELTAITGGTSARESGGLVGDGDRGVLDDCLRRVFGDYVNGAGGGLGKRGQGAEENCEYVAHIYSLGLTWATGSIYEEGRGSVKTGYRRERGSARPGCPRGGMAWRDSRPCRLPCISHDR